MNIRDELRLATFKHPPCDTFARCCRDILWIYNKEFLRNPYGFLNDPIGDLIMPPDLINT